MDTNRKVFGNFSPTPGAELRGVLGGYFNYQATSFLRFIPEYVEKTKPSHVSHRPIKTMPAIPRIHTLDEDSVVVLKQLISNLEVKIPSLVIDPLMGFGYQHSCLAPSARTLDSMGEPLLPYGKQVMRLLKKARILYLHAFRSGEEGLTPYINADTPASWRQWLLKHVVTRETDIPFASRSSADGDGLNIPLNRAGQPEFKSAYIPNGQILAVKFPTCLFEGETGIPLPALETWEARLIAIFDPTKEAGIRFVKTFNHFLQNLRASFSVFGEGCFKFRKLFNLTKAGYRASVLTVDGDTLLKSSIIESAAKIKPIVGFVKYLRVRQKAIFESLLHFSRTIFSVANLGKGVKPYRASPSVSPALKCGVLDGVLL